MIPERGREHVENLRRIRAVRPDEQASIEFAIQCLEEVIPLDEESLSIMKERHNKRQCPWCGQP